MADVSLDDRHSLERARRAQNLVNDPELQGAFEAVRHAIFDKIENCPVRDDEGLRILRLQLKLLADVKANLQSVINTGKVIEDRISFFERLKRTSNAFGSRTRR